jgi:hypothetical protein
VAALLAVVALAASYVPARRASRTRPLVSLKAESRRLARAAWRKVDHVTKVARSPTMSVTDTSVSRCPVSDTRRIG